MWDYTEKYPVLLEEKESDGTIVRYTYAGNRERVHADVTAKGDNAKTQSYSLYTDRLGSTRWALDENAEVAAKTEYDAWGKPETETVSSKLNGINISKSYTGYVYDETTGYWNAGARMYNSTDREFIQKDPKAGNVYETLTQNGYIYCGDNPLYYIDPDGCSYISTLGNAGRTAFNVVKSGVAGGLGFYTRVCCEIDNMPTWAKAAIGTTGIIIAGASGVGAAAIAEAVIASAGISAVTDGAFYTVASLSNGSFSKSELKDTVINGAANGYMFAGAGLGVAGIQNAAKSGKLAGFMADEAGSVSYEGGKSSTRRFYHVTNEEAAKSIIESGQLGKKGNVWENRVFAWTEQPTKKQANIAGIGKGYNTVLQFETNASFELDAGNKGKSIANIVVQTTDGQKVPISVYNVKRVGYKKEWWQFWKK